MEFSYLMDDRALHVYDRFINDDNIVLLLVTI